MRTSITTEQHVGFWRNVIVDVRFAGACVRVYQDGGDVVRSWNVYVRTGKFDGECLFATRAEAVAAAVHKVVTGEWP